MRIAIVGSGVAGLAAARKLRAAGCETVVFESEGRIGGRVETVLVDGCIVDTALQTFTPRGLGLEFALLRDLPDDDLVKVEKPIYLYDHGHIVAGAPEKNNQRRYTYRLGASEFSKLMAEGIDVRINYRVEEIEKTGSGFRIGTEEFDKVILTAPGPESERLLGTAGDNRTLTQIRYRPCLSAAIGFETAPAPQHYSALLNVDRMSPVLWLGLEHEKSPGRVPEGQSVFVAQMGPQFSADQFEQEDEKILSMALNVITRLYGRDFSSPSWHLVRRYAMSQPESVALFESVNRNQSGLIVAGDGTLAGRAENAYETGLMAADLVLAK